MVGQKNKNIKQCKKIESLEINLYNYGAFILNKGAKNTQWGSIVLSVNGIKKPTYPRVE